ncbi:MAG: tyrosine-type recombinase/integrase [Kiritimatiellia bacterium]|nr:tyrosine-type recombinase/integrase [Kiritimatiellia bacterium]
MALNDVWLTYERWLEAANKKLNSMTLRIRRNACKRFAKWAVESYPAVNTVGHDWYEASMIARHKGLRYSDIARIKTAAVNIDKGEIRMRPIKTKRFGIDITNPINSALMPVMEALVKRGGEHLFPEHAAAYPRFDKVSPFRDVLDAAKVTGEGHTFHSWRHTFRTRVTLGI